MRARHSISLLILAGVAALAGCTIWKEPKTPTWNNATAGEQLERLFWDTVKAKKWSELDKHMAPLFVVQSSSGTRDRAATLERLRQMDIADYSLGDVATHLQGDTLIVTYNITRRGSIAGQPFPAAPAQMMSVWQQVKRGWILIAHAETPAADTVAR